MKRIVQICVMGLLLFWPLSGNLSAADIGSVVRDGLKDLDVKKGQTELCVVTDATYVRVEGRTSEPLVDLIREETGCTIGKGNLLFFHRPTDYPLKIAIFRKDTEECAVVSYDGKLIEKKKYDLGRETVAKSSFYVEENPPLSPDTFTIVSLAKAWAAGAPHDLLKCAEFHNHFCPAIVSGYMIVQYISEKYPLKDGDAYTWIACPPWCKDDAVQVLLDLTPGKKCFYATGLTKPHKEELVFENPAGILIIWNEPANKGKSIVFSFDWNKVGRKDKLQMIFDLLPYTKRPEKLVSVVKECEVSHEIIERLKNADTNPYSWLGLTK